MKSMAVAAIVLNPSSATEFDIAHRNLYQMRCREAKEVCSVSCCGKPDSSKPGHDRVLSRLCVKDLTVGSHGSLRSAPRRKPVYSRELLSRAAFAGRLCSEAERSRQEKTFIGSDTRPTWRTPNFRDKGRLLLGT